jgi:Alpha-glutamyl/putrescinyl thymine pyrophosphorylase clade 3
MRVRREGRAQDDGFRSELVPGVRASADALRLVEEISFASGRLLTLATEPPGLYGDARALARQDLDGASWICFLIAYLSPLQDEEDPFAGIRSALAQVPVIPTEGELPSLTDIPLGPRTAHEPARGAQTLLAYGQWVSRNGGTQAAAFAGDPGWSPERRFERIFERLALPGFGRAGRYELLVTLGRLGCYELRADSLHLAGGRGPAAADPTTVAAKRVFGIGDELLLDRRAAALAEAAGVPVESLDLALANWGSGQRATVGVAAMTQDDGAYERAGAALGL